jgi:hypothetical protein
MPEDRLVLGDVMQRHWRGRPSDELQRTRTNIMHEIEDYRVELALAQKRLEQAVWCLGLIEEVVKERERRPP